MKKIVMLTSGFGGSKTRRAYFDLFVRSCGANPTIDFIYLTDSDYSSPFSNFKVIKMSLESFKEKIKSHYPNDVQISLDYGYKICDYFPALGEICSDWFRGYDFWGFLDNDLLLGDLRSFLTDSVLSSYKRISCRGHFGLFSNDPVTNRLYQTPVDGRPVWKEVFASAGMIAFIERPFDDKGMNRICRDQNVAIFDSPSFYDTNVYSYRFQRAYYLSKVRFPDHKKHSVFSWRPTGLEREYLLTKNGPINHEKLAYLHLQKRKMDISIPLTSSSFSIVSNAFVPTMTSPSDIWASNKFRPTINKRKISHFCKLILRFFLKPFPGAFNSLSWKRAAKTTY
jgi:hypothetical protein